MTLLWIGLGGFLGAIARYGVYQFIRTQESLARFPVATLMVNTVGCFLIGALMVLIERSSLHQKELYLVTVVGFLGAFTTFSAFGYETLELYKNSGSVAVLINISANVILGVGAVALGRAIQ